MTRQRRHNFPSMHPATPTCANGEAVALASVAGGTRARGAFTLIEIMVAVGAVALIAVGLAAIFDSVGKTVTGGRRVSVLTTYAALMEDQFRKDFGNMTRDGFLVIRQQYAKTDYRNAARLSNNSDLIELYANQPVAQQRRRRVDEILFFARGDFVTKRPPFVEGMIARSNAARIYYGHGQRRREVDNVAFEPGAPISLFPDPYDTNADVLGFDENDKRHLGVADPDNPNRYASEWTLLRDAMLLIKPETIDTDSSYTEPPQNMTSLRSAAGPFNRDAQIAFQPAAPSIFRRLCLDYPRNGSADWARNRNIYVRRLPVGLPSTYPRPNNRGGPLAASGVVDIATTDLQEIRSQVVNGVQDFNTPGALVPLLPGEMTGGLDVVAMREFAPTPANPLPAVRPLPPATIPAPTSPAAYSLDLMHAWMNQAFPTESDPNPERALPYSNVVIGQNDEAFGVRMRYEPQPPNMYDAISTDPAACPPIGSAGAGAAGQQGTIRARRADQVAITGSNFLPRCSEFIVEWSFGQTDRNTGEVKWFGLPRYAESNGQAGIQNAAGGDRPVVMPYPPVVNEINNADLNPVWHTVKFRHKHPTDPTRPAAEVAIPVVQAVGQNVTRVIVPEFGLYPVTDRLIYGHTVREHRQGANGGRPVIAAENRPCLTSYFGYVDPTFNSRYPSRYPTALDLNGDPYNVPNRPVFDINAGVGPDPDYFDTVYGDAFDSADPTIPCAWPTMVRITLSLADPRDPKIEETFQFVFQLPSAPTEQTN